MKARILALLFALAGLCTTQVARAEGPPPAETLRFESSQRLGIAGMIVGYAGPPVVVTGSLITLSGAVNLGEGFADGETGAGVSQMAGGMLVFVSGFAMNSVGPALLASGSVVGASAIQNSGGTVGTGAGWVAVGGSALQLASVGVRFAGVQQGMFLAGAVGWGTGMVAGTVQHVQNRDAWATMGTSRAPVERKRFALTVAPTSNGVRAFGTF